MKKVLLVLLLAIAAFAIYWWLFRSSNDGPSAPKQQALSVGKHSAAFNAGIDSMIQQYLAVKDALVASDSLQARQAGVAFNRLAAGIKLDDLKKDTTGIYETAVGLLGDVLRNAELMGQQQTLNDMRLSFKDVSDNMYPFLKAIHYEGNKLYWQTCPMAFGANQAGNWISNREQIENPYLGSKHNEINCGSIQDTIKAQ